MNNVTFVATSHIAATSVKEIKQAFFDTKPDFIAVELDKRRLHALLTNAKPSYSPAQIPQIGVKGYLFAVIGGYLQRKLGRIVGIQPGADMRQAAILAKNNELPILLLDQDITITLSKLSKQITFKEKMRFVSDLLFGWVKKQQRIKIDLKKVPPKELITKLLEQLKGRYPTLYKVLLSDRNHFMAKRLAGAVASNPDKKFLVVIGAGHEQGMRKSYENTITTLLNKKA